MKKHKLVVGITALILLLALGYVGVRFVQRNNNTEQTSQDEVGVFVPPVDEQQILYTSIGDLAKSSKWSEIIEPALRYARDDSNSVDFRAVSYGQCVLASTKLADNTSKSLCQSEAEVFMKTIADETARALAQKYYDDTVNEAEEYVPSDDVELGDTNIYD